MSYFERTKSEYWVFEDALDDYLKRNNNSFDLSLSKMSSDLAYYHSKIANTWRRNWKVSINLAIFDNF